MTLYSLLMTLLIFPLLEEPLTFALALEAQSESRIWWNVVRVESHGMKNVRSDSNACCRLQVLGGRYGNPSCRLLEDDGWICVLAATRQYERCRAMCGKRRAWECYHSGKCLEPGSYTRKVLRRSHHE